ncbi:MULTISPECIES: ATP-binding cassette domain-containing protein [Exiguobacterium]|uniref:ATP-binding cassette domain-containing protein n=1 Tax=Exiguobacterium TaxID=33986 RepID=UPI0025BF072D|nr:MULTISPECIES: ATP-binding cassette domain-containing protein [Exiguobacterium]
MYEIQIPNIRFDDIELLKPTRISIQKGKAYCIVGANGSGKTTLLNYILTDQNTEVSLADEVISQKEFKKKAAFIPNNPPLFDLLTGWENINYIASLWGIKNKKQYITQVNTYCKLFELSTAVLKNQVQTYSLGMKYKLFLIAMISREINLLLLDEPFTALDKSSQQKAYDILTNFLTEKNSIIFVTHIEEFRVQLSDHIYEIKDQNLVKVH